MEKRAQIMTTVLLTTLLICGSKETNGNSQSLFGNSKNNSKSNVKHVDVPHDHLPEEDMIHLTIKKQHQFTSLAK